MCEVIWRRLRSTFLGFAQLLCRHRDTVTVNDAGRRYLSCIHCHWQSTGWQIKKF